MTDRLKSYKKESNYSYVFGASPAIELLAAKSCAAECIYMRTSYRDIDGLTERCRKLGIPVIISDKAFNIAGCKETALFSEYSKNTMNRFSLTSRI